MPWSGGTALEFRCIRHLLQKKREQKLFLNQVAVHHRDTVHLRACKAFGPKQSSEQLQESRGRQSRLSAEPQLRAWKPIVHSERVFVRMQEAQNRFSTRRKKYRVRSLDGNHVPRHSPQSGKDDPYAVC